MKKLISKVLKESNVNAKIGNGNIPKFKVTDNKLTLEGIVKGNKYSMKIKDHKGNIIDNVEVTVNNDNDVVNRINESIMTLKQLSPIHDKQVKLQEEEEFEEIPEAEPGDLEGAVQELNNVFDNLMDFADSVANIGNYFEEDDVENKNTVTSFVGAVYDLAMDIEEFAEDTVEAIEEEKEEAEAATESFRKPRKSLKAATRLAIDNITIAEAMLRGHKSCDNLRQALRDIKSELLLNR